MFQVRRLNPAILFACAMLAFTGGCGWLAPNRVSEANDPHYRLGLNRKNSGNIDGAIDAFEKALQTNPYSAVAHAELGWIYYQEKNDPAAAIYHFRKFEQYTQEKNKVEFISNYIESCKQQLAREVSLVPVNDNKLLQDYKQLNEKKDELVDQNLKLRAEITRLNAQIEDMARSPGLSSSIPEENTVIATVRPTTSSNRRPSQRFSASARSTTKSSTPRSTTPAAPRTYTIKKGDNFYNIAQRYNLQARAIQAANPRVDPRRLQTGQVIRLPAR